MPCYLLHMIEQPDDRQYADPDVKDVVGTFPQFYCAHCDPAKRLRASEGVRCLDREAPCWKAPDRICTDDS